MQSTETPAEQPTVERLRYERWLKICKAGLTHTAMWNNRHGNNLDPATLSQEQFDRSFTESLENHKERSEVRRQLDMANKLVAGLIAKHPDAINSFTFSDLLEHRIPHGHLASRVLRIPEDECARRLRREIMNTARDLIEKKAKHAAYLASLNSGVFEICLTKQTTPPTRKGRRHDRAI